jgi:tetratricopeptide (TPR) repeat protein
MNYPYGGVPYAYPHYAYTPFGPIWYSPFPAATFMPAEQLFGPAPIMRLMGVDQWFNRPAAGWAANQQPAAARPRDQDADVRAANEVKPPHPAAARAVDSAWKLISFGDSFFGNRKFADALDRYRKAAQSAPQVADAWFRQGFANAAMGHYDRAAKAIRRGLEIKPDWASSGFRLDDLFGDDTVAKKNLLDAMLKVAEAEPANADVSLLVGLCYHFDGKPEQAAPFLRQAAEVGGNGAALKNFLDGQKGGAGAEIKEAGAGMRE